VVCATDGLLSFGGITADVMPSKTYFINEWLFMYAGTPSQAKMILGEMWHVAKERYHLDDGTPVLNRENIQEIASTAYNRRMGKFCSAPILGPLGIDLDEFREIGLQQFGESEFQRINREIRDQAYDFTEQLLVVGWGKAGRACMIYEVGPSGDYDHALHGVAAIGSGAEVAMSTLLQLGQSRDSTLPETLYAVASAKFSVEKSYGDGVGPNTSIYVCEKLANGGKIPPGKYVQPGEVNELRALWEEHGRPKIPDGIFGQLAKITDKIGYPAHVSPKRMDSLLRSRFQKPRGLAVILGRRHGISAHAYLG
jgi:hypothetical protein